MTVDLIVLYKELLHLQGIAFTEYSDNISSLKLMDYGFRERVYGSLLDQKHYFHRLLKSIEEQSVIFFQDDFGLNYCFFRYGSKERQDYGASFVLIGPVLFHSPEKPEIQSLLQEHQLPITLTSDTMEFYNRVPKLPAYHFFNALLSPMLKELFPVEQSYQYIRFRYDESAVVPNQTVLSFQESSPSFDAIATRYQHEEEYMEAVASGNVKAALEAYHRFRRFMISPRNPNQLRDAKNGLIIFNTLLRQAVQRANVHPYYIDALSREFAILIENASNVRTLQELNNQMLRKYTMLAHNYSTRAYSKLVASCIDHIRFHYKEPITLELLADTCAVSPNYLSTLFKKETGTTITKYIQKTRLDHAIRLLNTTDDSIHTIANACGFSDYNYFIRIFRMQKGISPNSYRKNIGRI